MKAGQIVYVPDRWSVPARMRLLEHRTGGWLVEWVEWIGGSLVVWPPSESARCFLYEDEIKEIKEPNKILMDIV